MMTFIWLIGVAFTFGVYTNVSELDGKSDFWLKRLIMSLTIWPFILGMAVGQKLFKENKDVSEQGE
ncbi:hypothetical protein A3715_11280 [Oleiphilus sp. HI0009]|nr:hypothetical protein A3715_24855 [Oleiphilus sp. HI0009]KZX77288.1 hypothetical protein A3715_11280 [Oleiphilus sp. HI0009]